MNLTSIRTPRNGKRARIDHDAHHRRRWWSSKTVLDTKENIASAQVLNLDRLWSGRQRSSRGGLTSYALGFTLRENSATRLSHQPAGDFLDFSRIWD